MNGFTAADMSMAAASAHNTGYQAGYADAVKAVEVGKPAAAQEAAAVRARLHEIAYRDSAVSVTVRAEDLRAILAAPVAAAPVVRRAIADEAPFGLSTAEKVAWARGVNDALEYIITPAAPWIDLAGKSGLLRRARSLFDQDREYALERGDSHHAGQCTKDIAAIDALSDASPKGEIDPLCAAKRPGCNYPACGCTDASPKGGSDERARFESWASKYWSVEKGMWAGELRYHSDYAQRTWDAWQAALQATSAEVGE